MKIGVGTFVNKHDNNLCAEWDYEGRMPIMKYEWSTKESRSGSKPTWLEAKVRKKRKKSKWNRFINTHISTNKTIA